MNTQIEYLEELREDLLSAAWREADRAPARRRFSRTRRLSRGKLVAAMAAVTLVLAGGIGWYTLFGAGVESLHSYRAFAPTTDRPSSSNDSAAKSDGNLDFHAAVPSPVPAPANQQNGAGAAYAGTAGAEGPPLTQVRPQHAGGQQTATSAPAADYTRIIKTAEVGLIVPTGGSLKDRFDSARGVAHRYGGFVEKSSIQPGKTGQMEIRVPARNFDATITALEKLGSLEHESIKGQDVTAQFVDLQARLSIAQTHRDVLVKLLSKAHSPEQFVRMQNLVDDAQLKVEQLQGEIRLIKNQTSKATIDLSMRMAGVAVPTHGAVEHPGLGSAWAHAIAGFFGVVFAVVVGLGYLVPIAVVLLIGWVVVRRFRRRTPALIDE